MKANTKEIVAKNLLKIKAVFLSPTKPFRWSSGIISPIYCDNRLIISYPKTREIIEDAMVETIKKYYKGVEAIVGTSTAGVPHAAIIATKMNLPMAYVRSKPKDHGTIKCIEGFLKPNQKVVVIEDLLSTANSAIQVVKILRESKIKVMGICSIFNYNMTSCKQNLAKAKIINHSLSDLDTLIKCAVKEKYINQKDVTKILKFRDNPIDSNWMK